MDPATLALGRTSEAFGLIEEDARLDYNLPRLGRLTAGQVLKHCFSALDQVLVSQKPCIYKVGYTHCAHWRFYNDIYGYYLDADKWKCLTILYTSYETTSASFVEAALIQREMGHPIAYGTDMSHSVYSIILVASRHFLLVSFLPCSGKEGCRNLRDGGETIKEGEEGPFMVYVVCRSFRRPSNAGLKHRV